MDETSLRRHSFCSTGSCDSGIDVNAPEEIDVDGESSQLDGGILKSSRSARSSSPPKRHRRVSFHPSVLLWASAHNGDYDSFFNILVDAHADLKDSETQRRKDVDGLFLHTPDKDGITLLHLCCFSGSIKCVRLLLTLKAQTSVADNDGWTPLHAAAAGGHIDIVHVIVTAGVDLEATDSSGRTPFDVASNDVTKACLELYCLKFDDVTLPSRPASRISDV